MPENKPKKKTAILHFLPLELYPPVMNFASFWAGEANSDKLDIYTTKSQNAALATFTTNAANITIHRYGFKAGKGNSIARYFHYCAYYLTVLFMLVTTRPDIVLYYDSISSFPAIIYKRFFKRSCRLFIHYHEYMSKPEYASGMTLLKWFNILEKKIYPKSSWLSHTNQQRMDQFLADNNGINIPFKYILPNYPPRQWSHDKTAIIQYPVKVISVGALGLDTMYTREFAQWVLMHKGLVQWHIYSLTITDETKAYLQSLDTGDIFFKGSINYQDLPAILQQYDVGVILYKGHIPNFIYNAPNKLFEYHVCGLDTWFPKQMVTACEYATSRTYPKILPLDFDNLKGIKVDDIIDRSNLLYHKRQFTSDSVYQQLKKRMLD